jgi:hypothetical protein
VVVTKKNSSSFRFSLLLLTANRTLAPIFPYVPPFPMVRDVSPRGHDVAYGYKNLAVLLQYQGVANLDGLTAALKLPIGFQAWGPSGVRDDRNNYDVSLSNYNKQIGPNNAIVLCFTINIVNGAPLNTPVIGALALHYPREDPRTIMDSMEGQQVLSSMHQLKLSNGQNMTTLTNNFNDNPMSSTPALDYQSQFNGSVPSDIINQVIPVILQVTDRPFNHLEFVPTS